MDSGLAALIGALVGSAAGVIGSKVTTNSAEKVASRGRSHEYRRQQRDRVSELYEEILAGLVNFGNAQADFRRLDPNLLGVKVLSQLELHGSETVRRLWNDCFAELRKTGDPRQVPAVAEEMRQHLRKLDEDLMRGD